MREFQVSNHLSARLGEKEGDKYSWIMAGLVALLVSIVPGVLVHIGILLAGVVVFLVLMVYAFIPSSEVKILREGIQGENILKTRLKEILSDEYIALFNVPLFRGDIDCFLIGPSGAYLIDSKNHNGYILYFDGKWVQKKVGKKGAVYDGEHIKAPDLQVKRAIYEVKNYLREKGLNIWIEGAAVFTNPNSRVFSADTGRGIKVLSINELESLFTEKKKAIEPEKVETIASLMVEGFGKKTTQEVISN